MTLFINKSWKLITPTRSSLLSTTTKLDILFFSINSAADVAKLCSLIKKGLVLIHFEISSEIEASFKMDLLRSPSVKIPKYFHLSATMA